MIILPSSKLFLLLHTPFLSVSTHLCPLRSPAFKTHRSNKTIPWPPEIYVIELVRSN